MKKNIKLKKISFFETQASFVHEKLQKLNGTPYWQLIENQFVWVGFTQNFALSCGFV